MHASAYHGPCEHHLQQHGHGSGQGSVSLQQVLWILPALHQKNMACPYKDCVHKLVTDELQTENAHGSPEEGMET